jgi:hypothetical protein
MLVSFDDSKPKDKKDKFKASVEDLFEGWWFWEPIFLKWNCQNSCQDQMTKKKHMNNTHIIAKLQDGIILV